MDDLAGAYAEAALAEAAEASLAGQKRHAEGELSLNELVGDLSPDKAFMCFAPNCGKVNPPASPPPPSCKPSSRPTFVTYRSRCVDPFPRLGPPHCSFSRCPKTSQITSRCTSVNGALSATSWAAARASRDKVCVYWWGTRGEWLPRPTRPARRTRRRPPDHPHASAHGRAPVRLPA